MLLEGIGKALEQLVAVFPVVGKVGDQGRQPLAFAQLIEPMTTPRTVVEKSMQVSAGDAATSRCCAPPAETWIVAERLETIRSPGAAVVQFKAEDRSCPWPERLNLTLSQGLRSTELCCER